jgi:hypothetical protein
MRPDRGAASASAAVAALLLLAAPGAHGYVYSFPETKGRSWSLTEVRTLSSFGFTVRFDQVVTRLAWAL